MNTTKERPRRLNGMGDFRYTRDSVERALVHHFGEGHTHGGPSDGRPWVRLATGGYSIHTGRGNLTLKNLREAAIFVIACATKEAQIRKETSDAEGT